MHLRRYFQERLLEGRIKGGGLKGKEGEGMDEWDYKKLRTLYCGYDEAGWIQYQYLRR